jgi:hypothetical protein
LFHWKKETLRRYNTLSREMHLHGSMLRMRARLLLRV